MNAEDLIKLIEYGRREGYRNAANRLRRAANSFEEKDEGRVAGVLREAADLIMRNANAP